MVAIPSEVQHHVPAWVARHATQEASGQVDGPWALRFPAAVMMVDVSGFTALGERLAQRGHEGAELLWRVVNAFFSRALDVIQAHGGDVLRFAGDAPLVLFAADGERDVAEVTRRAVQCGLTLQNELGTYDTGQNASIRFRVALAAGEVLTARIGGVAGRWEPIVGGALFEDLAQASDDAEVGEVVLSPEAFRLIDGSVRFQRLQSGTFRVDAVTHPASPAPLEVPALSEATLAMLERHVPRAVVERLEAGHGRWLGELRTVSTVFVAIDGLDYTAPAVEEQLDGVLQDLQRIVYRYQGEVNQF